MSSCFLAWTFRAILKSFFISLTDSSGYISLNDYQLSITPQMRVIVQTLMHLPLLVLLYWQGNWALFNRSHISIKVFRKSDHVYFFFFFSPMQVQKGPRFDGKALQHLLEGF